jgi:hypothetical protein
MAHCPQCGRILAADSSHQCPPPKPFESFVAKFWSLVNKNGPIPEHCPELGPCWLWTGDVNTKGYGWFYAEPGRGRQHTLAHRFAWKLEHGEIAVGVKVLHRCDTKPCVRETHLFPGTNKDNSQDMARKGRAYLQKAPRAVQLAAALHMREKRRW